MQLQGFELQIMKHETSALLYSIFYCTYKYKCILLYIKYQISISNTILFIILPRKSYLFILNFFKKIAKITSQEVKSAGSTEV
jgi:hypothetical protein